MKKILLSKLQRSLEMSEFSPIAPVTDWNGPAWFSKENKKSEISVCLRVEYGSRLRVFSFNVGWRHRDIHEFCLEALEDSWPNGRKWLLDSGFLLSPCMNYFNLGELMGWGLSAVPADDERHLMGEISRLCKTIDLNGWSNINFNQLVDLYKSNKEPFSWLASNSALRLAEIAAICSIQGSSGTIFEECATEHQALIQADMFNLGNAVEWISALRKKMSGT